MRFTSILLAVVLCAGVLTAGEDKTIDIEGREIAVPVPKLARFRQDYHEDRLESRKSSRSPFTFDYFFVHSVPHTHVTFAYYQISHMARIPGIEKITFPVFRVFVDEIKGTLENKDSRDAFIEAANRKFAEKNPDDAGDVDAFNIEDAGTYYGNAIIYTNPSGERHIEASLYFLHDEVIYRMSIDDFNSKSHEDSFAKLVLWMNAFLDANTRTADISAPAE